MPTKTTPTTESFPVLTEVLGRNHEDTALGGFARTLSLRVLFRAELGPRSPLVKQAYFMNAGSRPTIAPVIASLSPPSACWVEVTRKEPLRCEASRYGLFCAPHKDGVVLTHVEAGVGGAPAQIAAIAKRLACEKPQGIDWQALSTERYPGSKGYRALRNGAKIDDWTPQWYDWWDRHIVLDIGGVQLSSWQSSQATGGLTLMGLLLSPLVRFDQTFEPWALHGIGWL